MDENADFFVVDFDRTLADSDKFIQVFIEIADRYFHISKEEIERVDAEIKQRGDTFLLASYVRDNLRDENRLEDWEEMAKMYIHESRALNYMLPGGNELLEWLESHGKRHGILTYGDAKWQKLKLSAVGFNHTPHIIMDHKEKGRFITTWQQDDGLFKIPEAFGGGVAKRIVLIDDKAVSFHNLPQGTTKGYWVLDATKELPSQKGEVPENVTRHSNLYEVIEHLEADIDKT